MPELSTFYRTHTCGALRLTDVNRRVVLCGWVQSVRKMGALLFIDLRDRYGITQLVVEEKRNIPIIAREYVISASGTVVERTNKNLNNPTGEIEISVAGIKIMSVAHTPPFTVLRETDGGEELRMRYRYLDLRRPPLKENLILRHKVSKAVRDYLNTQNFLEIETPFLIKSTPEGARDFIVPSRMNPHTFYALPQSPQLFKQLLMIGGYDRYYQIVRCFRDEDLRADRQPEFTQIDCEMSFVSMENIMDMFEGMIKYIWKEVKNITLDGVFTRITWQEAMDTYGTDKPDLRCEMFLQEITECVKGKNFPAFDKAPYVVAMLVKGGAEFSRKELAGLTDFVRADPYNQKGLAYIKCNSADHYKSSFDSYVSATDLQNIAYALRASGGDLILILAGEKAPTAKTMGALRLYIANKLGIMNTDAFKFVWVTDFPLLEYKAEEKRFVAVHHPFTAPKLEDIPDLDNPEKRTTLKADAYDLVLNGVEIGGGSLRIYDKAIQTKIFAALGLTDTEIKEKFGFLLSAFEYGAPPHGGIAFGFDRLCALMGGSESIREFIAFPKNNNGRDTMLDAPATIETGQLSELQLSFIRS